MLHDIDEVMVSQHLACAVMYGDVDGLSDLDAKKLHKFVSRYFMYKPTFEFGEGESSFERCAITGLFSDCIKLTVWAEI